MSFTITIDTTETKKGGFGPHGPLKNRKYSNLVTYDCPECGCMNGGRLYYTQMCEECGEVFPDVYKLVIMQSERLNYHFSE